MREWITKAGDYTVERLTDIPQYDEDVDLTAPRAGVLHTTEGGWAGSDSVFEHHYAPHFMVGMDGDVVRIAQLVPVGRIGAACRAHNNKAIVQIEMIGYSKETLWQPDVETAKALAALMVVCRDEWGIPLSHPWPESDWGRAGHNPHRSSGKFGKVAGWFGHADMPDPDVHWDPGHLDWDWIFSLTEGAHEMTTPNPAPSTLTDPVLAKIVQWAGAAAADLQAALAQAQKTNNAVTIPAWTALLAFANQIAAITVDLPMIHLATDAELVTEVQQALQPGSPLVNACAALAQYQKQSALAMVNEIVTGAAAITKFIPLV
jgi:hypothetical protein